MADKEPGGELSGGLECAMSVGTDICEVREAMVPLLPDNVARPTCRCKHKCVDRVKQAAAQVLHHLRNEVRDKQLWLELLKHAHLATESPSTCLLYTSDAAATHCV